MWPAESRGTRASVGPLPNREVGSGATEHMTVLEPSRVGRQGLKSRARGSVKALLSREAGSDVVGHMAAPETSQVGRQSSEPQGT
jgi:hypothetical protein